MVRKMQLDDKIGHVSVYFRALDKLAYCVNYENIWKDMHFFKFLCVSSTKIKLALRI